MTTHRLKSYAKVNLTLDVLGRDEATGYHFMESVVAPVYDLYDEITIEPNDELIVETDNDELNLAPEENLAYKAALGDPVKITIKKNIPLRSGLGGGSSNAAAILNHLHPDKAATVAASLGMDIPYFVQGGVCFCTHYGEIVEPIETDLDLKIKLTPKSGSRSTQRAYSDLDLSRCGKNRAKTKALIQALRDGNLAGVRKNIHNDFGKGLTGSGPSEFILAG